MELESAVNEWLVALVDGYRMGDGATVLEALADVKSEQDALLATVDAFLLTISSAKIRELLSSFDIHEGARSLASWTHGIAAGRSGVPGLPIREWAGVVGCAAGILNAGIPTDIRRRITLFATLLSIFTEGGESALLPYEKIHQESVKLSQEALLYFTKE